MSAGKAQDDPFVDNDPWLVQNAKGRVRQAEHGAPAKPTLEVFMPPGFANIEHDDRKKSAAEVVVDMKAELASLDRQFKEASRDSPKRQSDGMPTSRRCRELWDAMAKLNGQLGQLRGRRPSFAPGAARWRKQRLAILEERGGRCDCCSDGSNESIEEPLDLPYGEEVSDDVVSEKGLFGGHS